MKKIFDIPKNQYFLFGFIARRFQLQAVKAFKMACFKNGFALSNDLCATNEHGHMVSLLTNVSGGMLTTEVIGFCAKAAPVNPKTLLIF